MPIWLSKSVNFKRRDHSILDWTAGSQCQMFKFLYIPSQQLQDNDKHDKRDKHDKSKFILNWHIFTTYMPFKIMISYQEYWHDWYAFSKLALINKQMYSTEHKRNRCTMCIYKCIC